VRTTLLDDDEHVLLIKELATLYRALDLGAPAVLAKLPMQYADLALRQQRRAHSLRHRNAASAPPSPDSLPAILRQKIGRRTGHDDQRAFGVSLYAQREAVC
jgi:hypothetical protein